MIRLIRVVLLRALDSAPLTQWMVASWHRAPALITGAYTGNDAAIHAFTRTIGGE